MAIAADTKEAKYTQGFSFQQNETGPCRPRQVVERSCTALMTLLQELFVQVERQISGQLTLADFPPSQQRLLEQLAEVVRARPIVERAVITSVVCAFADLEDRARGNQHNGIAISQTLAGFNEQAREAEDLMFLLGVEEKVVDANNSNRPLLFHLNAQWALLFGLSELRLQNSPLGPATLTAGFVAGLLCVRAEIATKCLLFQMFEQHLLGRLSILLNSITLRLEEEGIQIQRAVSFDEEDAGPMKEVLQVSRPLASSTMEANRERIRQALLRQNDFIAVVPEIKGVVESLLCEKDSAAYVHLLSELTLIMRELEPVFLRAEIHHQETSALASIRQSIAGQLNEQLVGKILPDSLRAFFACQWPDVLFEVAVSQGIGSEHWIDTMRLQQQLLNSVIPADSEEQRRELARVVPSLVKNLRENLEQAGYSLAEITPFLSQLKPLHLANVQNKLEINDFVSWHKLSLESWMPSEVSMVSEADRNFYEQVRTVVG